MSDPWTDPDAYVTWADIHKVAAAFHERFGWGMPAPFNTVEAFHELARQILQDLAAAGRLTPPAGVPAATFTQWGNRYGTGHIGLTAGDKKFVESSVARQRHCTLMHRTVTTWSVTGPWQVADEQPEPQPTTLP